MIHPTVDAAAVHQNLDDLLDSGGSLESFVEWTGEGDRWDGSAVDACVAQIHRLLAERLGSSGHDLDDDQFEGAMSELLYNALKDTPIAILDDPGFWAYLATGPLWFFVRWREDPNQRQRDTYYVYIDGRKFDTCVPLRMFLRAQAVELNGDVDLVDAIEKGTDFWRSHVLRVRTSTKPELARAVAGEQVNERMPVGPLRAYAKRINRRWSNEVLYLLDEESCRRLAAEERDT